MQRTPMNRTADVMLPKLGYEFIAADRDMFELKPNRKKVPGVKAIAVIKRQSNFIKLD